MQFEHFVDVSILTSKNLDIGDPRLNFRPSIFWNQQRANIVLRLVRVFEVLPRIARVVNISADYLYRLW